MLGAIPIDSVWLLTVFLLSLRLTAVFTMTPLLAAASVPPAVRVLLVLGLAAALSLGLPAAAPTRAAGVRLDAPGALLAAGFTELALGATLSLGVLVAFAAFNVAGRLLDVQIGFGLGQVIDPASNASQPVLTSAFSQLSVLVFFPAKIVVGLLALSLWFGGVGDVMSRVYGGLYRTWDALLADDGGAR